MLFFAASCLVIVISAFGCALRLWRIDEVEITPMSSRLEPDAKLNDMYKVRDVAVGTTDR